MATFSNKFLIAVSLLQCLAACTGNQENNSQAAPQTPVSSTAQVSSAASGDNTNEALKPPFTPLMRAIFGDAYKVTEKIALVSLVEPEHRNGKRMFRVNAVDAKAFPNGNVVLIANAAATSEDGDNLPSHADSGYLNVFLLRQQDGRWQVLKRHENIAALGSTGNIGQVAWVQLAADKPGFAMLHGWSGQGYNIGYLSLFNPNAEQIKDLTGGSVKIHSDNTGTCEDDTPECWDITGAWHIGANSGKSGYCDLNIVFSGEQSKLPAGGGSNAGADMKRISTSVSSTARYVFDGKQYRLVEGTNVVPDV